MRLFAKPACDGSFGQFQLLKGADLDRKNESVLMSMPRGPGQVFSGHSVCSTWVEVPLLGLMTKKVNFKMKISFLPTTTE